MKWKILLFAAALALGFGVAKTALATFDDPPCYPDAANVHVCAAATVGQAYSVQLVGRDGTGCWPFDTFRLMSGYTMPPGLSISSSGLISGTPTASGTWSFFLEMQDFQGPSDTWCTTIKSYQREFRIAVNAPTATTTTTTPPPTLLFWHLSAGSTVLHSERATTYANGTTGLGLMLTWMGGHKDAIRSAGSVSLTRLSATS